MVDRCGFNENDPRKWERDWDEKNTQNKEVSNENGGCHYGSSLRPNKASTNNFILKVGCLPAHFRKVFYRSQ